MSGIHKGEEWGTPTEEPATLVVRGSDGALASAWAAQPEALIRFVPTQSDLALTLGLGGAREPAGIEVALDVLAVETPLGVSFAVAHVTFGNAAHTLRAWHRRYPTHIRIGATPDASDATNGEAPDGARAVTTSGIVVLNAQHLAGRRVAPRGHPGDGRIEIQWFGLAPADRAGMRRRLARGDHLPHPAIGHATGRVAHFSSRVPRPVAIDGEVVGTTSTLTVTVRPAALRLLL